MLDNTQPIEKIWLLHWSSFNSVWQSVLSLSEKYAANLQTGGKHSEQNQRVSESVLM